MKRRYTEKGNSSRRSGSRAYYVNNDSGTSTKVCRTAFLRIHGISGGRVDRAVTSIATTGGSPHMDLRGRHEPANKTGEDQLTYVKNHISSFPQYGSHYSRSDNPHRKYLSPDLSVSKMYVLYKELCEEEGGTDPVSEWIYRKTFNESFNLTFGR